MRQQLLAFPEEGFGIRLPAQIHGVRPGVVQHRGKGHRVTFQFSTEGDGLLKSVCRFLEASGSVQNLAVVVPGRGQWRHIPVGLTEGFIKANGLLLIVGSLVEASQHAHGGGQLLIVGSYLVLGTGFVSGQKQNLIDLPGIVL